MLPYGIVGGWKSYDSNAEGIDNDYNSGGPLKGTSLGLLKRLIYTHLMYDCVAVGFEGSMRIDDKKLSPIGKIQQSAVKWVDKYGDPGVMYTPVALMTDFFSGWSFRVIYIPDRLIKYGESAV